MTGPLGEESGRIYLSAHVDGSKVEPELERAVKEGAEAAEADLRDKSGPKLGDATAEGMAKSLENKGKDLAQSIEKGINREHINVKNVDFDRPGVARASRSVGRDLAREFEQAFAAAAGAASGSGGPISKIGDALRDAVGAGFNISGKSPLIGPLIPVFGALAAAITAAVEAAGSLVAVLTTLPAALAAIGVQVGILFVAFSGLNNAIGGALNSKTVKEFNEALKNLAPSAQDFVRTLVPALKSFQAQLGKGIQDYFFANLGDTIVPQLLSTFQQFIPELKVIAGSLGQLFFGIASQLNSNVFIQFLQALLPLVNEWVNEINPALQQFIGGLTAFAYTTLPFFQKLGKGFADFITKLGKGLEDLAHSNDFKKWLEDMLPVLKLTGDLLKSVFDFVVVTLGQLNSNGGKDLLAFVIRSINTITAFLATPIGGEAFQGLVTVLKFLTILFLGLVVAVGLVLAAITAVGDAIDGLGILFDKIGHAILTKVDEWRDAFLMFFFNLGKWFGDLPEKIVGWIGNVKDKLFQKGKDLVEGFINGIKSQYEATKAAAFGILDAVTRFLPGSPTKEGPLSGQGYVYLRGQRMVKDFAAGIDSMTPSAGQAMGSMVSSNIVFGPNAIRVSYEGVQPSPDEARMTGSAIGEGVLGQLAARNEALAVRTL